MARILIVTGVILVALGLLLKLGVPIGRLPGDIVVRRESGSFYFPIVTCLVVSLVLTLILSLLRR